MQSEEKWPTAMRHSNEEIAGASPSLQSQTPLNTERTPSGTDTSKEHKEWTPLRNRHICGFGWKAILLAIAVIFLTVLAVILGSVLGTRKHDAVVGTSQPSSGSASNSSSAAASVRYPSIAATVVDPVDPQSRLFYYDNERKEIMAYSHNTSWDFHGALQSLPAQPRKGNSLAAVSWIDGGNISTRLFYIEQSSKIIQLSPVCDPMAACEYESDHMIFTPSSISTTSNIAAVHWGNSMTKRISLFYVGNGNRIHEMRSNANGQFSGDNVLGVEVYPDSSLAATWNSDVTDDISLFFTSTDQKFSEIRYNEGVWQTPTTLEIQHNHGVAINAYSPITNLAATTAQVMASDPNGMVISTYRIDVTGYPAGISYAAVNGSTAEWESERQPQWRKADDVEGSGIAAVSWYENGQYSARLYYPSDGVISEMATDGANWYIGSFNSN